MDISRLIILTITYCTCLNSLFSQTEKYWAYDSIYIPQLAEPVINKKERTIIIAVIDDGFFLTHHTLKNFIYQNKKEIPGNQLDDDGNGYIDDVNGWDISDKDGDVSIPLGRAKTFFHGTYIASIITEVARRYYVSNASDRIKILPIKVISDYSEQTHIEDGYKAIKYAMDNGADIICMAWSGGNPGEEDLAILKQASEKGILLIGSAGNLQLEQVDYPAKAPEVLAIGGVDQKGNKQQTSNFGLEIDLAAPASQVFGAHPEKDNAYIFEENTSPATALVTGAAGILLAEFPNLPASSIRQALINSSTPFSVKNQFSGKLGAGKINLTRALAYLNSANSSHLFHSPLRPKGRIHLNQFSQNHEWKINPPGGFHGSRFSITAKSLKQSSNQQLHFFIKDTLWNTYQLSQLPKELFIPSSNIRLVLSAKTKLRKKESIYIDYQIEPIDSSQLYCSGVRQIEKTHGKLEDGSKTNNYTNHCSCKWLISVPAGQRIQFTFDQLDTEGNVDFIYLVDGRMVLPDFIFAKFSGNKLPPIVQSSTNEVLVWFVTDGKQTGHGWSLRWKSIK